MTAHLPPPAPDATPDFLRYQRERDLAALQQALMSCAPVLLRTARRHSVDEAEDLVHETFAVAIRRADDFTAGGRLLPWLLGILENCARARTRRRWSRLRFGHDGALDEEANDDPLPPAVVERREWIARAVASVRALPEPYRDVVAGHLLDGEALTELSTRLGRPASTVTRSSSACSATRRPRPTSGGRS